MAPKQAQIDRSGATLTLRDLDSPGGTFVNRQRLLAGQARALAEGDVLQLGGVQLKLVREGANNGAPSPAPAPAPVPAPAPAPVHAAPTSSGFPFTLRPSGATCRTWDDFLVVSAQRWGELRDELESGRLAAFVRGVGRSDLAPEPAGPADERLDAWLAKLPTTKPARAELDVHPRTLVFRAGAGGGTTRKKVQIANAGHRLLRTTARVEPPSATWLKVDAAGPIVTVESTDLAIDVSVPEGLAKRLSASIVLDSNGGSATVAVTVEPIGAKDAIPSVSSPSAALPSLGLRERIATQPAGTRLVGWTAVAALGRLAIAGAAAIPSQVGLPTSGSPPDLIGPAALLAIVGAFAGMTFAARRKELREMPFAGFAGGVGGVMMASVVVAICRTAERGHGLLVAVAIWAAIGAAMAGLSILLVPEAKPKGGGS